MNTSKVGAEGEKLAISYLINQNHKVITTNFHYKRLGEIDIITLKNNTLHFIEVKTRKNNIYGFGYEAVNNKKLAKILKTAQAFMALSKYKDYSYQLDIVSITLSDNHLDYYENITH